MCPSCDLRQCWAFNQLSPRGVLKDLAVANPPCSIKTWNTSDQSDSGHPHTCNACFGLRKFPAQDFGCGLLLTGQSNSEIWNFAASSNDLKYTRPERSVSRSLLEPCKADQRSPGPVAINAAILLLTLIFVVPALTNAYR